MGYYVTMIESTAYIPDENVKTALECTEPFVDPSVFTAHGGEWELADFLTNRGFQIEEGFEGEIVFAGFNGKHHDDMDILLAHLAPAIKGEITWQGEDGALWKDEFRDGKMIRRDSVIQFGPPQEVTEESIRKEKENA